MKHWYMVLATLLLTAPQISEARCWGAGGYCTRARHKRYAEERAEAARQQCVRDAQQRRLSKAKLARAIKLCKEGA